MIMPFEYYLNEGKVEKQSPNPQKALSLMNKSIRRIEHIKAQKLNAEDAEFLFEDIYESIREAGQSLMALRGYKPLSHEAVIAFIRDVYNLDPEKINKFDRYRKIRNKLVYEADKIAIEDVKEALQFAIMFVPELNKLLNL